MKKKRHEHPVIGLFEAYSGGSVYRIARELGIADAMVYGMLRSSGKVDLVKLIAVLDSIGETDKATMAFLRKWAGLIRQGRE